MKMSKKLCPGKICVLDLELRVQVMSYGFFSSLLCDIGILPLLKEKEVQHHIQQSKRHEFTFCFGTMKWPFFKKKMRIFYP